MGEGLHSIQVEDGEVVVFAGAVPSEMPHTADNFARGHVKGQFEEERPTRNRFKKLDRYGGSETQSPTGSFDEMRGRHGYGTEDG